MNLPAQQQSALVPQPRQQFDLSPQTFEQALTFCDYLADSDLAPKDFKGKPANCLIAIQWGSELGLKPLQAVQNIAVINGRAALWGDAVIALVRSSPLCEYITESDDGNAAICKVKRRGEAEEIRTFSMDDAKAAGLAGKQGPWTQYPKRMRQMRARAFALRDVFPDVLRGMPIAEEVMDIPASEPHRTTATVVSTEPAIYSAEEFAKNLPDWKAVIESGRKSADDLIAMVEARAKARMTDEQRQQLRNCEAVDVAEEVPPAPAANTEATTKTDPIDWDAEGDRA
ncbi:recombinase RecT [Stenotrophomonas humi]|uniref:recombinase RecT n=1 Tax=Stenotrophomonas humi TaxID=405444 RepID=UPI000AC8AD48|nr:recombinase RecT [Stenotrophomonas humi]